jgi:glyoxylase-like metal-dependent hydrolase (beta-lactamase superfamily II)
MSTLSDGHPINERVKCSPEVAAFFERRTCAVQYVVCEVKSGACAIIDPVLDYDEKSGSVATRSADALLDYISEQRWHLQWILDTHPHADHLSAAHYLRVRTGAPTGIGERVVAVQNLWKHIYNLPVQFRADGSQWDRLFADGERFELGGMELEVLFSPGHTPASVTYMAGDAMFVHDSLLMPDYGTARCDFPGGDARELWRTLQRILAQPDHTRVFVGHDYMPGGRPPAWESTIGAQQAHNIHLQQSKNEQDFVRLREERDLKLPLPKLMLHALQVNIVGGRLPKPEENGLTYLRIPVDAFPSAAWD